MKGMMSLYIRNAVDVKISVSEKTLIVNEHVLS